MGDNEKSHFNAIAGKYHETAKSWETLYVQTRQLLNPIVTGKRVADVGNGGVFVFDPGLTKKTTCLDIAESMLAQIQDDRVEKIVTDARSMDGIADESVDAIVFNFSLHHINGSNVRESLQTLEDVISASNRKLVRGGKLIIGETVFNRLMFTLQSLLFPVTKLILATFGVSMIYQFSQTVILEKLARCLLCRPESVMVHELEIRNSFDPLGGSFPGTIKIPGWFYPGRFLVFIATKPEAD